MRSLILASIVIISGCASTVEPPVTANYADLESTPHVSLKPAVLKFPKAKVVTENGVEYVAFTVEDSDKIIEYRQASKNNRDALVAMVGAHNEVIAERNILVDTLKLEEARKNYMAERYADAENGRRYEQRENLIETSIYKALLVIIGLVAL